LGVNQAQLRRDFARTAFAKSDFFAEATSLMKKYRASGINWCDWLGTCNLIEIGPPSLAHQPNDSRFA